MSAEKKWDKRLADSAARHVDAIGLDADEVVRVLERLALAVPHLELSAWRGRSSGGAWDIRGEAQREREPARTRLRVVVGETLLEATVSGPNGQPSVADRRFLSALATEAAQALFASRHATVSLVDFGTAAVAAEVRVRGRLAHDPLPLLQLVRSLRQSTYENAPLSYGVILSPQRGTGPKFTRVLRDKGFRRLTDGIATALVLNGDGGMIDLVPLISPPREGTTARQRAWRLRNLAHAAAKRNGVGVALTDQGDLYVLHQGRTVFCQRAGVWRGWSHSAIHARVRELWDFPGPAPNVSRVLSYMFELAQDLSAKREGGLLVVLGGLDHLERVLANPIDRIGSAERGAPKQALDAILSRRAVHMTDRRVLADLAALDGALVVDRNGRLLAYGAMLGVSRGAGYGARTRAAATASARGIAFKVSSDGGIFVYRNGKCVLAQ